MRKLTLYRGDERAPIEEAEPLEVDQHCERCSLHRRKGVRVCLPAEGEPGGLLVVGEAPGRDENSAGRPFVGSSGRVLRAAVRQHWKGPVAIDNAVKCLPPKDGPGEKAVAACRGYLAQTIREVQPTRIVTVGGVSVKSLFGRAVPMLSSRRAYSYLPGSQTPVFFVLHPAAGMRNRFIRQWWDEDIRWALTAEPPSPPPWQAPVRLVQTALESEQVLEEFHERALGGEWFAFDVETIGRMYGNYHCMISLAICPQDADEPCVWTGPALQNERVIKTLRGWFADPSYKKVAQNTKFDAQVIHATLGVDVAGLHGDVRLWRKLLFADADAHLNVMAELVGMGGMKEEMAEYLERGVRLAHGAVRKGDWSRLADTPVGNDPRAQHAIEVGEEVARYAYGLVPHDVLYRYNARDSVATSRLGRLLEPQVSADANLARTWRALPKPAMKAIEQVERWGVRVDQDVLKWFSIDMREKLEQLTSILQGQAGSLEFNPGSNQQVADILYKKLKFKPAKLTPSGAPSTDEESLAALKGKHPFVDALLEYRKFEKLRGTYADGMLEHIRADGRVHPSFNLDGARSGRLSCSDPNLQNIPRPTSDYGKMARDCFTVEPGFVMLSADYSQIELRVAAALSGDPVMRQIFIDGVDYHQRTAEMVSRTAWNVPPEGVTKEMRSQAKIVNFSMLYGAGDGRIADAIGTSVRQAEKVREAILGNFKLLAKYIRSQLSFARKHGEVWTWWDGHPARKRGLWRVADPDDLARSRAENGSFNSPVQGTASDFCLASLCACVDWIREGFLDNCVRLVCAVHDSLIFEVREDVLHAVAKKVRNIMTGWPSLGVPLVVDMEVGTHWGSLKPYEFPEDKLVQAAEEALARVQGL
jgi:uracil-DNA glycosylase family 4